MLGFTPAGVDGDVCAGVRQHNTLRPALSPSYVWLNTVFCVVLLFLFVWSAVHAWQVRKTPRFAKIRPVGLSWLSLLGMSLFLVTADIGEAFQFPCMVRAVLFPVSISFMAVALVFGGMIVSLEARFAILAQKGVVNDDGGGSILSRTSSVNKLSKMALMSELFMGCKRVKNVQSLEELNACKDVLVPSLILYSFPGIFGAVILVVTVIPSRCAECTELFLETPLTIYVVFFFYFYSCFIAYYDAFMAVKWDPQGVIQEFFLLMCFVMPLGMTALVLMTIDVGDYTYFGIFNWQGLWGLTELLWWSIAFGLQFFKAYRESLNAPVSPSAGPRKSLRNFSIHVQVPKITDYLVRHPDLKPLFVDYAAKLYVSENFTFLEDAILYRSRFSDNTELWRSKTAQTIIETYIREGSLMQVNISGEQRIDILEAKEPTAHLFDEAISEIEHLLEKGPWSSFYWKFVNENRVKSTIK